MRVMINTSFVCVNADPAQPPVGYLLTASGINYTGLWLGTTNIQSTPARLSGERERKPVQPVRGKVRLQAFPSPRHP